MRHGHNKVFKLFSDIIEDKEGGFLKILLGKKLIIVIVMSLS